MSDKKSAVKDFWDAAACGEVGYAIGPNETSRLDAQARIRFVLEPYIRTFARFDEARDRHVLEIGVGMGADHLELAKSRPRGLAGIDLTKRAIAFTEARLKYAGLQSDLRVADAESLPFPDASFDLVYSWGVIHHSPDTPACFREVARVLKPGGLARIMIYHKWSLTGLMLRARYGLGLTMKEVYDRYLESPGTKAFTQTEARAMCHSAGFRRCCVRIQLNHGDLLEGVVGQRHRGRLLSTLKVVWPRWLFKRFTPFLGLYLFIEVEK